MDKDKEGEGKLASLADLLKDAREVAERKAAESEEFRTAFEADAAGELEKLAALPPGTLKDWRCVVTPGEHATDAGDVLHESDLSKLSGGSGIAMTQHEGKWYRYDHETQTYRHQRNLDGKSAEEVRHMHIGGIHLA